MEVRPVSNMSVVPEAGLEPVPIPQQKIMSPDPAYSGPQYSVSQYGGPPYGGPQYDGPQYGGPPYNGPAVPGPSPSPFSIQPVPASSKEAVGSPPPDYAAAAKRPWWKRPRNTIAATLILILLIVGGVVGGVLGSRAAQGSDDNEPQRPAPSMVRRGSSLAVTSYTLHGEDEILLSYQDTEGHLRYSVRRTESENINSTWTDPQMMPSEGTPATGTSLAFSTQVNSFDTAHILYYFDDDNSLRSVNISTFDHDRQWTVGPAEALGSVGLSNSNIGAYGPWLYYSGNLGRMVDRRIDIEGASPEPGGNNTYGRLEPAPGTEWAILPLRTNLTEPTDLLDIAIISQLENGTLASFTVLEMTNYDEFDAAYFEYLDNPWSSWPDGLPEITFPLGNPFAGFVTARSEDSTLVNTHIIYKSENGTILELWSDNDEAWQHGQPSVFAGADDDTDLACLTMTMDPPYFTETFADEDEWWHPVYLIPNTHLQRCFFQREGYIVEVRRSEDGWQEMVELPMS